MVWESYSGSDNMDGSFEAMVGQIKELQRGDADAREQWAAYVEQLGQGKRDPSKHTADFLENFLVQYQSGQKLPVPAGEDCSGLGETIKIMQKRSSPFKSVWAQYCQQAGHGRNDPSKHDSMFHAKFFEYLAQGRLQMAGGMQLSGGEGPLKRIRDGSGAGMGTSMGGGGPKEILANQVKAFQRMGTEQKELWGRYADAYLQGVRDPSRHDAATLQDFVSKNDVPSQGSMGNGSSAGVGSYLSLVSPSKAPSLGGGAKGAAGSMQMVSPKGTGGGAGGGSEKEVLANQVKSFQRMGTEQKELWGAYADAYLGGLRDPARHDAATLRDFCKSHSVPPAPSSVGGSASPGQLSWGDGVMDPEKDSLVQRVKFFQKASKDNADIWATFCGNTRDPNRHESSRLREFCQAYGC